MRASASYCSGWIEALIGGLSAIVGVSLFINSKSLIYALLEYHGIRISLAVWFVITGIAAVGFGITCYSRWRYDKARLCVDVSLLLLWITYSLVANLYVLQFPVALMSFLIIPVLLLLIVENLRNGKTHI